MVIIWIILFLVGLMIYSNTVESFVNNSYETTNIKNHFFNQPPNIPNIWINSARVSQELYNKTYAYGLYNNIIYDNFKYQPIYPETISITKIYKSNSPPAFNN